MLILFETDQKILVSLEDNDKISDVQYKVKSTWDAVTTSISRMEKAGFVSSKKIGRSKFLKFTDKGKKLSNSLKVLCDKDCFDP